VCQHKSFHIFQLIELGNWTSLIEHAHGPHSLQRCRVQKREAVRSIAHDQIHAVVREPPPFRWVTKLPDLGECVEVIYKSDLILPGKLVQLVVQDSYAFSKILFIEDDFFIGLSRLDIEYTDPRMLLSSAFIKLTVVN